MICVTGGSGFLGSALVKRLVHDGESVRVLDLAPPASEIRSRVAFIKGNVRDRGVVEQALKGCRMVYHAAGILPLSRDKKDFYEVNVQGTRQILESAKKNGLKKVIYYSSGHAVYGLRARMPIKETDPQKPFSYYGKSKYAAEELCRAFREQGLNVSIVRPATVVGPGRLGTFKLLFDWIRAGKNVYLIGNGRNRVQYVSLDDLVEASLSLRRHGDFSDYNIGTDRFSSFGELIAGLVKQAGSRSKIVFVPTALAQLGLGLLDLLRLSPFVSLHYRTFHLDTYYDVTKAKTELGWQPKHSNEEMFKSAYDWYIREGQMKEGGSIHQRGARKGIFKLLDYLP